MKALLLSLAVMTAMSANAQDTTTTHTTTTTTKESAPPEWLKHTQPSAAHKKNLELLVGSFTYTSKMWMEPTSTPEESSGTSEAKWILDGRFVQETVKGKAMGQDFEGISIMGYDNFSGEYQTIWLDSMNTAMMYIKGGNAATAKTIKQEGTASNAFKNDKNYWMRSELKIKNRNQNPTLVI